MFGQNNEYTNATKNARINTYDNREISVRLWLVNFSLFSLLIIGSYYTYLYFNKGNGYATIVMGVSHTSVSDDELMIELHDVDSDKVTIQSDYESVSEAMKKIVDESTVKSNSKYIEELTLEVHNGTLKTKKITFEEKIANELKSFN